MPWSPVPKFPKIVNHLEMMGFKKEVTLEPLRKAIMTHTGVIRDDTLKTIIEAMETLEFITKKPTTDRQVWIIGKPKKKTIEEDKEEIDKRIDEMSG